MGVLIWLLLASEGIHLFFSVRGGENSMNLADFREYNLFVVISHYYWQWAMQMYPVSIIKMYANIYSNLPVKTRSRALTIVLFRRTFTHKWIIKNMVIFMTTLCTRSGISKRFENLKWYYKTKMKSIRDLCKMEFIFCCWIAVSSSFRWFCWIWKICVTNKSKLTSISGF